MIIVKTFMLNNQLFKILSIYGNLSSISLSRSA